MSENTEMSLNRKIAIGILSIITIGFIGAAIYFLSKSTEKKDPQQNFSDNSKGYVFLSVGIVFFITTIVTVINPKIEYNPYYDPYLYNPYNQPFRHHHRHHNSYYPRRPTPYPYSIVSAPLF